MEKVQHLWHYSKIFCQVNRPRTDNIHGPDDVSTEQTSQSPSRRNSPRHCCACAERFRRWTLMWISLFLSALTEHSGSAPAGGEQLRGGQQNPVADTMMIRIAAFLALLVVACSGLLANLKTKLVISTIIISKQS